MPDRRIATVAAPMERFVQAFGHPVDTVLSDNGTEFTDRFRDGSRQGQAARPSDQHPFDRLCVRHGIDNRLTRPCHPQTNGMVGRLNRRLGEALHAVPQLRDTSRHRTRFASHAGRTASIFAFVRNHNRTGPRCLQYKARNEIINNLTQHNTEGG